jgi:hypothetical protein
MPDRDTLTRLIEVTERFAEGRPGNFPLDAHSAISQDANIFGIDTYDYFGELEAEFGPIVREIPWMDWTDQTESYYGCAVGCFPLILLARLLAWPFRKGPLIKKPDPRNFDRRLELEHIAKVIDQGFWSEP